MTQTRGDRRSEFSRRRFIEMASVAAAAAWAAPRRLLAQSAPGIVETIRTEAAKSTIEVQSPRTNVRVLSGSGGNMAVLLGSDGKLLVDAGIAASHLRVAEALAKAGPGRINHLVNTHWHFDHTDGNAWLHAEGASIIAHENTRKHLAVDTRVEGWNFTVPATAPSALPDVVIQARHVLEVGGETIVLQPYGPAHTDSDISVHFTIADVLHVGDTWWNRLYPFIDYSTGGSIAGTIRAAEANVAAVGRDTVVIPGHGAIGGKPQLVEYLDMLVTVRDRVAALKKEGRSRDEVIAAAPTKSYDREWGSFPITGSAFSALVYAGV